MRAASQRRTAGRLPIATTLTRITPAMRTADVGHERDAPARLGMNGVPEDERRDYMRQRCQHPGGEIEQRESAVAQVVLDVVAEDPQEQHVAEQVHQAAVHEHRDQQCEVDRARGAVGAGWWRARSLAPPAPPPRHPRPCEFSEGWPSYFAFCSGPSPAGPSKRHR